MIHSRVIFLDAIVELPFPYKDASFLHNSVVMNRIECPSINTVMVTHPFKRMPFDICPREEIAAPYKLLAVAQTRPQDWDEFEIHGHSYMRVWIQMRTPYPSVSRKVRSHGFYCATQDPAMFATLLDVEDTHDSMLDWLLRYAKTPAIITTPLFSYRTKYQDVMYHISNTFPQRVFVNGEHTDLTQQMLDHNAYTICNGLTLAIAMHRLGFWSSYAFQVAFMDWLREEDTIYTDITPDIQDLLVQHTLPHICDHPYYYAVMGSCKANINVIKMLHSSYDVYEPFMQLQDETVMVVTNATLQMMPYAPMDVFDYVTHHSLKDEELDDNNVAVNKTDLGGLMHALFTQKGIWKRWQTTYRSTLEYMTSQCESHENFIYQCARRSFVLYSKGSHVGRVYTSRIRKFWGQLIEVVDPTGVHMLKCVHKHIIHAYIHQELEKRGVFTQVWLPKIPVAFLVEMMRRFGGKWHLYDAPTPITILTSYPEISDIFDTASIPFGQFHSCIVQKPLIMFMSKMRKNTSIHTFYKMIRERAQDRLRIMRAAFMRPTLRNVSENEGYTIWTILQDYFTDHKESLVI